MNRRGGFTLVEAAVAIAVVTILGGVILPLALKSMSDARLARARHDLNVIAAAIVSQVQDTGCRPRAPGGPGRADGSGIQVWRSPGKVPGVGLPGGAGQTFVNLFTAPDPGTGSTQGQGNALFGLGELDFRDRFRYRGPYLSGEAANRTDPWGNAYLIVGFDERGQGNALPIRVVCLGEGGTLEARNLGAAGSWDFTGLSAGNLVVQVH